MTKRNQAKNIKHNQKTTDREEFGYGYDISVNDLGVKGKNNDAKKKSPGATRKNH